MAPAPLRTRPRLLGPRRAAFTLIELAVTITVVAVVAALGTGIIVEGGRAYAISMTQQDNFSDANYALNRMVLELRNVVSPADFLSIGTDTVSFRVSGETHTFAKSGIELLRDGRRLATGVSAFSLTYYDASNTVTATPASVRRIAIAITVNRNNPSASLRSEVFPRAFRVSYISWQEQ